MLPESFELVADVVAEVASFEVGVDWSEVVACAQAVRVISGGECYPFRSCDPSH